MRTHYPIRRAAFHAMGLVAGLVLMLLLVTVAKPRLLPLLHAQTALPSAPVPSAPSFAAAPVAAPVPVAQADAACARCHAAITSQYLATPHALASGQALARLIPGVFVQPAAGVTYTVSRHGGAAWLSYSAGHDAGPSAVPSAGHDAGQNDLPGGTLKGTHRLDVYLGSGHLGTTYLYSTDGYLFESPVAYYTHLARYDMKPGLAELAEGAPAIPIDSSCLRCHMSGVVAADPGTLNHYTGAAFRDGGITCESCHGDTAAHVASGGKAPVVNPAKLTAVRRDSVCISCHLEGDVSVEKNHRSALDYRPGEDISEYLSFFVYSHAGANARGVSEVEQFAASHCKRASGDSMSCASCHDPHSVPSAAERVMYYRAKCLNCHGVGQKGIAFVAAHHPENPDCTSCHMPKSGADNIPHVAWTDHRILARPDAAPNGLANPDAATDYTQLLPIFSPMATSRDLALAFYSAVMEGHTDDGGQAYALLTQAWRQNGDDVQVLNALGTLAVMKGDSLQAGHLFASVLALDPKNRAAAMNLGVLAARNRNLAQARALLQPVFDRNQDLPAVAENLAAVDCLAGDGAAARATLTAALRFSPGSHTLRTRLQQVGTCGAAPIP